MTYTIILKNYIDKNYEVLKTLAQREWYKTKCTDFNEDTFHDTLIKCMDKFNNSSKFSDFIPYFIKSFRINIIRESLYHINANRYDCMDDDIKDVLYESHIENVIDYNTLLSDVCEKFGRTQCEMFEDWLNGFNIRELNEMYGLTTARYIIEKIRRYVSENYRQ